MTIFKPPLTLN